MGKDEKRLSILSSCWVSVNNITLAGPINDCGNYFENTFCLFLSLFASKNKA